MILYINIVTIIVLWSWSHIILHLRHGKKGCQWTFYVMDFVNI